MLGSAKQSTVSQDNIAKCSWIDISHETGEVCHALRYFPVCYALSTACKPYTCLNGIWLLRVFAEDSYFPVNILEVQCVRATIYKYADIL